MKKLLKKWFSQDYIVNTVAVVCILSVFIFSMFYIILKFNLNEPTRKYQLCDSTLEVTADAKEIVSLIESAYGIVAYADAGWYT